MQSRRLLFVATFLLGLAPLAYAQQQPTTPAERAAVIRDAFASPYGKALTAEFGKSLRKDADPACLKDKGLEAGQLEALGRDLLIKWGANFLEGIAALYDMKVYAELFTATDEMDRLKQNADVKRYLAISAPVLQAGVLDAIFVNFEHNVLIRRIRLTPVHPLDIDNQELQSKNPTAATEKAVDKFLASNRSAALDRFLDLSEDVEAALDASIKKDRVALATLSLFKGIGADLAELCVK